MLQIPSSALGRKGEDGRYAVRVVDKDGRPQERRIRVGMNNNVMAEVIEGLSEGENVVSADVAPAAGRP